MIRSETIRALCDFAREHGAGIDFRPTGSGHDKATLTLRGRSRFIILSRSPRGANRNKVLSDARRALRELSAAGNEGMKPMERDEARMRRWRDAKGAGRDW